MDDCLFSLSGIFSLKSIEIYNQYIYVPSKASNNGRKSLVLFYAHISIIGMGFELFILYLVHKFKLYHVT